MVTVTLDRVSLGALRLFNANNYFVNVCYNFFIHGFKGPSLKSIPNTKIKWVPRALTRCLKQMEVNVTTYLHLLPQFGMHETRPSLPSKS
jgi:hypothetical protein